MPIGTDPTGLDDATLLQYAQQAGVVPNSSAPMPSPGEAGAADPSQFTAPAAPEPTPPTSGPPNDTFNRLSVSQSGYSTAAAQRVDKQGDPGLNKSLADADAVAKTQYAGAVPALAKANDEGVAAVGAEAKAQAQLDLSGGREARILADLQTNMGADEAKINEHYRAESNQSKADYMAALTDLRGSRVDPSALWKQMGPGNQFGMLVSAFVQDFLGVRGIHVSAMDTFNKAVERNIDAQVQAIKTKGDVAEGFKSLWYMQRSQASSDAEARTRVRGFLLDGAKQAVVAHMAQYKSALSDAQGQAAIAKLDDAFSKNLVDVYHHIDQSAITRREQAIQIYGEKLKASMEQQRINLERDKLNASKLPPPDITEGKIVDPWTHKYAYSLGGGLANLKPEDRAKTQINVQQQLGTAKNLDDQFNEIRDLARKMDTATDTRLKTRFKDTIETKYQLMRNMIAQERSRDLDGRVNWNEIEQNLKSGLPNKLVGAGYDLEEVLAENQKMVVNAIKSKNMDLLRDLDSTDPARTQATAATGSSGINNASTAAAAAADPAQPDHEEVMLIQAQKKAATAYLPDSASRRPVEDSRTDVLEADSQFTKEHPDAAAKLHTDEQNRGYPLPGDQTPEDYAQNGPRKFNGTQTWEEGLVDLRDMAKKGGKTGDAAYKQLQLTASSYLGGMGSEDSSPESVFAAMLLHDLSQADSKFDDPTKNSPRFKSE